MDRNELTKAQRWEIADRLAAERLPLINEGLKEVIPSTTLYARYGKRILDVAVSGAALLVCFPINAVLALCTLFDVGRPIIFRQERAGRNGKAFTIIKFRNMRNDRDERGELLPARDRVTKFGMFMRKTSLDELWNFWSVFKGDMSLIGPRPLVPEYTHRYNKRHAMRLAVRPGLECPPRALSDRVWTLQEQFENDVWYVENISLKTDCAMLVNLLKFALDRKSAKARAASTRGTFMGYNSSGVAITLKEVDQHFIDSLDFESTQA